MFYRHGCHRLDAGSGRRKHENTKTSLPHVLGLCSHACSSGGPWHRLLELTFEARTELYREVFSRVRAGGGVLVERRLLVDEEVSSSKRYSKNIRIVSHAFRSGSESDIGCFEAG